MKRFTFLHTESPGNFARQFSSGTTNGNNKIAAGLSPTLGEGFLTVLPFSDDVEVMLFNITRLDKDLHIDFLPGEEPGFYFIRLNDFIEATDDRKESVHLSGVSLSDSTTEHNVFYPKGWVFRSAIIKIRKNSLPLLLPGSEESFTTGWSVLLGNRSRMSLPVNFKYRILLNHLMEEMDIHPFPELFIIKNISSFLRVLRDEAFYYSKDTRHEYNNPVTNDVINLFKVERYLTDNYKTEFPGVQKLSRLSMMSPTKLKSAFKRLFGYTLFDYYQKHRLELSRMMLLKKKPVKIVAAELGYSNPSHFSLAFRKEFGIPPSKLDTET